VILKKLLLLILVFNSVSSFAGVLSAEQSAYLNQHGAVKVCVDPDWYPFEILNEKGEHVGIAADLLRLTAGKVGAKLEIVRTADWDESIKFAQSGKCEALSFLNSTPERDAWLNFTRPIFTDVNVFVTREEHRYIPDPSELSGETIVFPKGTAMEELIRRDYPELRILTCESERKAFQMVSDKKADMTMRSLIMAAYTIKEEGLFNLKISGQLPDYTNKLRIGVIKSEPALAEILDTGVSLISNSERQEIVNKHIYIKAETGTDYELIAIIVSIFCVLGLLGGLWMLSIRRLNRKLVRISQIDRLTGICNRTRLDEIFAQELDRAKRYKRELSVLLLDIDYFKRINDEFGHLIGDKVLIEFVKAASDSIRTTDAIGRWGGEEFLVICPETGSESALVIAERIRVAVKNRQFSSGRVHTVSIGVTTYEPEDTADSMLLRADAAMYCAKDGGRDTVCSK
jgi:diguanylate cyclase (GGDEF)-like protein